MKKTILIFSFLLTSYLIQAQNVTKDAKGNYTAIKKVGTTGGKAKDTGKTFTDASGKTYPVMMPEKGKLFVVKTSAKTGNSYNYYLKITGYTDNNYTD